MRSLVPPVALLLGTRHVDLPVRAGRSRLHVQFGLLQRRVQLGDL